MVGEAAAAMAAKAGDWVVAVTEVMAVVDCIRLEAQEAAADSVAAVTEVMAVVEWVAVAMETAGPAAAGLAAADRHQVEMEEVGCIRLEAQEAAVGWVAADSVVGWDW